jgi:hypothetical protein
MEGQHDEGHTIEPALGGNVSADPNAVDSRDETVLRIIDQENLSQFSFDGIRRRSGLHQETLSRILDRLEDRGILSKLPQGYSVVKKPQFQPLMTFAGSAAAVPLLQTLLPNDVEVSSLITGLKGRWFGRLRWMGLSESDGETSLKWISDDGGIQVDAAFSPGELNVTAHIREGWKLADAVRSSYELVGHLTGVYGRLRPRHRVALFSVRSPGASAA